MPGCRGGFEGLDEVTRAGEKASAVLDQVVAAFAARIERRAGNGKDIATLLGGKAGSNERARSLGGLDDHYRAAYSGMMRLRRGKCSARGTEPGVISVTRRPRAPIASCSSRFSGG